MEDEKLNSTATCISLDKQYSWRLFGFQPHKKAIVKSVAKCGIVVKMLVVDFTHAICDYVCTRKIILLLCWYCLLCKIYKTITNSLLGNREYRSCNRHTSYHLVDTKRRVRSPLTLICYQS